MYTARNIQVVRVEIIEDLTNSSIGPPAIYILGTIPQHFVSKLTSILCIANTCTIHRDYIIQLFFSPHEALTYDRLYARLICNARL